MSDIKLFRFNGDTAAELKGESVALEKSLQNLMERHLPTLLGVHCLGSEYTTGRQHGGRIDTLGIDENNVPVIIEYKRAINENVINQGLFYLDWLLDHRSEFKWLVMEKLGKDSVENISWENTRLLCIAGDFTRYDMHAVKQINRNVELIRYKRYGDDLLLLDLVNAVSATNAPASVEKEPTGATRATVYKSQGELLQQAPQVTRDAFDALKTFVESLGDDVQYNELKYYFAFRRLKNFMCIEVRPSKGNLLLFLKVDPDALDLEEGFARDVRNIGHWGTGDLEVTVSSPKDVLRAEALILRSYEAS
jgi:predicted transport protein